MKKFWIIVLVVVLWFGISFLIKNELFRRGTINASVNEQYSGKISRKFIDSKGAPRVIIDDEEFVILNSKMYDFIRPGDSLVKKRGTTKFILMRMNDTFHFYPEDGEGKDIITDNSE